MKHKFRSNIYVILCLTACLVLGVSAFFSSGDSSTEMRDVSDIPKFINDDKSINENFDSEISDYLSVSMPIRNIAIRLKAVIMENVFISSAEDDVIIGKNGWYYFNDTTDEYLGADLLSDRSIMNIADTVEQMQEYCEENSIKFVFTVAPNKNTLYPENMPSRYIASDENNYTRLCTKLKNSGINYVDFSSLDTYSDSSLYYATDSHWNTEGAIIAYNQILDSIGKAHEDYSDVERTTAEKTGDLIKMLYPDSSITETESVPDYDYSFEYASRLKSEEDINIRTANADGEGSLLMFRDSFSNALLPLMAETYASGYFTRAVPCDLSLTNSENYDTVIYEIVQRNLENIISYAPVMKAKEYFDIGNIENSGISCSSYIRETDKGLVNIYGTVDSGYLSENGKIYLKTVSEYGDERFFRCFNIYEKSLFNDDICRDNGYSVYIDSSIITDRSSVYIIVENEGKYIQFNTDL